MDGHQSTEGHDEVACTHGQAALDQDGGACLDGQSDAEQVGLDAPPGLMFWMLIALAAVGFVPCIVLPIWRDYQGAVLEAQIEKQKVAALQAEVTRQRRVLEAIRTDPAVSARLAQRELAFQRPGHRQVPIAGDVPATRVAAVHPVVEPLQPPQPIARVVQRLPDLRYDGVFCYGPSRLVIMVLSAALVVAAFVLYPARPQAE